MIRYQHVCVESMEYVLPDEVVSSVTLEQELAPVYERFGVHEGRLELMTGIRERRFWREGTMPSDGSTAAGKKAIAAAGITPDEVECLIHTSVSRDCLEPATASIVHDNLSLPKGSVMFDISNACLGFLNGMITLANMIELGQVRRGLIVAGESSRQLVRTTIAHLLKSVELTKAEFKAAFASLTIGSGAVAAVLGHDSVATTDHRLLGGVTRTATEHNHLCRGSADTGFDSDAQVTMKTDAETLLNGGCELAAETWSAFRNAMPWIADEGIDRAYCHQVGATHRDRFYEVIDRDPSRDFSTFEFLGNVGSVSLPITMAMDLERNPAPSGARIAMLGIGSGLSSTMLGLRW